MESQPLQRKTEEPASSSQSDFSSQSTIIQSLDTIPKGPVQDWLQEAPSIIRWLQGIPPFHRAKIRLSIENWLRELEETEETALLTQLAQSIFSFAETKAGRNFRLEDNDQHSEKSNKRICKAPEAKSSPAWKGIKARVVEAVDEELNENALTKASSEMPEVRLVIKSPYIGSEDLKTLNTSIRYPSQEHMFGVVQDTVNFTVKTNFRFDREVPFGFWCDIIYDPASDGCHIYNRSGLSIYLMSSKEPPERRRVRCEKRTLICSGAWRISIQHRTTSYRYPIFDILVRKRSFSISTNRIFNVRGSDLFSGGPPEAQETRTSILDFADGETARITDLCDDEKTYELTRIAGSPDLSTTTVFPKNTNVFSCQHSRLPGIKLVAKVFRVDNKRCTYERMRREMELLKQLCHPNIVSLEDADPRVLTLYLEHLPRSLDNNDELEPTWDNAETILNGISSALAYLSKKKIIHYDVKPANIAFSRERGAILFDFDLGDHQKPKYGGGHGGTFGYLPPETIEPGKTRGFRGDVWALGVTILWIMGWYIPTNPKVDDVDDFHQPNSNIYQMLERQLRLIDNQRNLLDREHYVQDLVYKMLEPKSRARVAAAIIHRKLQGGRSAKRRKYS